MDDIRLVLAQDEVRTETLNKCEVQIRANQKRGIDALRSIGKALKRISDEKLYEVDGYRSFTQYVETKLNIERNMAWRVMSAAETILTLEHAGIDVPQNEAHLVLLNRIPAEELPKVWINGLEALERAGKTANKSNIKKLVDTAIKEIELHEKGEAAAAATEPKGVNPVITIEGEEGGKTTAPAPAIRTLSEAGELALERIGRLVGKEVSQAILKGTLQISERDLIGWSEQDDQMLENLAYYIVGERWSLRKALAYELDLISEDKTLGDLALLATARGGEYNTEIYINNTAWAFYIKRK